MPKQIDPALRERAVRMMAEHQQDYSSLTSASKVVADKLGVGKGRRSAGGRCRPRSTPATGRG